MNTITISTNPIDILSGFHAPTIAAQKVTETEKPKTYYTNEAILSGLKERNEKVIKYIYRISYPQIRYFVTSNSGTTMDAEDVFQDAIVLIYKKLEDNELRLTSTFNTFVYSICRHLWLQKLNKKNLFNEFNDEYNGHVADLPPDKEELEADSLKSNLFHKHFARLKPDEQKVLKLYISKTSAREIARIMGYKSDKYAKFRKYLCKEKLKNMIINDEEFSKLYQCG